MTPSRIKPNLVATPIYFRTSFFPDQGPLLETLIFFEISYDSYQPFNFLPYLSHHYSRFHSSKGGHCARGIITSFFLPDLQVDTVV